MFKVTITKNGVITNQAQFPTEAEANAWLAQEVANKSFGKPERWVTDQQEDVSQAVETRVTELQPEQSVGYDADGVITRESRPAISLTEYLLPAEYTVEVTDITAQDAQEQINQEALIYLAATDWMVVRAMETSTPVPEEILNARASARSKIVRSQGLLSSSIKASASLTASSALALMPELVTIACTACIAKYSRFVRPGKVPWW